MRFDFQENEYIVFLSKESISEVDFKIKKQVENCFRDIFNRIKKRLNKEINGFFNIKVYLNNDFGAILIMCKEELEYYDYFSSQIDMQISIEYDATILLEFNDIFDIEVNNNTIYAYDDKFYIKYIENLKYIEFSNVVYGKKAEIILKKSHTLVSVCDKLKYVL